MKHIIALSVLLATSVVNNHVYASSFGVKNTEEGIAAVDNSARSVEAFNVLKTVGNVKVNFTQSATYSVDIVEAEGQNGAVKCDVVNGILTISDNGKPSESATVNVCGPTLMKLEIEDNSSFSTKKLCCNALEIECSDNANTTIEGLGCHTLKVDMEGNSMLNLDSVRCDRAEMDKEGNSSLTATMQAETADIEETGNGMSTIKILCNTLNAENSGLAKMNIECSVTDINIENTGNGSVNASVSCSKVNAENSGNGSVNLNGSTKKFKSSNKAKINAKSLKVYNN